jgi:hypothetical protein
MSQFSEYDQLLSRYVDGSISADELARLEARLLADEQFAEHVSRWCLMHRQVGDLLQEMALHELMDGFVTGAPAPPQKILSKSSVAGTSTTSRRPGLAKRFKTIWLGLTAMAAAILAAISFQLWSHRLLPSSENTTRALANAGDSETGRPQRVGTLTQIVDATWIPGAQPLGHGAPLATGTRIALQTGMAKVTFDCGVEVVLEGPCDFIARGPMVAYLAFGKITADVPRRAFGFAILSPQVDFVDVGTSFGLSVGQQGRAELYVFRGEVLCSRSSDPDRANGKVYHVMANEAVEFVSAAERPSDIAMNEEQFTGHFNLRRGEASLNIGVPADNLALWLAADSGVTTDSTGRVISWQDILFGDNQSGEDAIQADESARPGLIQKSIAERPAIRFDGTSDYLLTTPLATTDDQTVVFVCQFSQSATDKSRRWGGQILNYDGPPSRFLSDTLEPGVLQIGEPLLETQFQPTLLTAQVFAGFIGSATVESGRVDAMPVGIHTPVVVAYRYDLANARATLMINGKTYGEMRAFAPQAITSRKIIGRHAWMQNFFHGDLAELLIYNQALSDDDLAVMTQYLADKYAIRLAETDR